MNAYTGFAAIYDEFMDNVPYDDVADYLEGILESYGIPKGLLLELGCGTGQMCERMSRKGYDMIGVDSSADMLSIANETNTGAILYLLQDMREFELYGTVGAAFAVTDTMNYITSSEDFLEVLRLVNNYLDPGGIFVFDMKTDYFFREVLQDSTFAENREDASIIWENTYDPERKLNEYALTIFAKEGNGLFRKEEEFHYQRAYDTEEIKELVKKAGLIFVDAFTAYTKNPASECQDERIYFIVKECGK